MERERTGRKALRWLIDRRWTIFIGGLLGAALLFDYAAEPWNPLPDEHDRSYTGTPAATPTVDWDQGPDGVSSHRCEVSDGALTCAGRNRHGQLGTGDRQDRPDYTRVLADHRWLSVSNGRIHTCAVDTDHALWCWGANAGGQLGTGGPATDSLQPQRIPGEWEKVALLLDNTCAFETDGNGLWCWGVQYLAADGSLASSSKPVRLA